MSHSEIDTPWDSPKPAQAAEPRLPWESIHPHEHVASHASPAPAASISATGEGVGVPVGNPSAKACEDDLALQAFLGDNPAQRDGLEEARLDQARGSLGLKVPHPTPIVAASPKNAPAEVTVSRVERQVEAGEVMAAPASEAIPRETEEPAQQVEDLEPYREEEADEANEEDEKELVSAGSGWTIPLLCLGLGLIACCVVIPQADSNRRLYYEQKMLKADLEQVQKQVAVNAEFLTMVSNDPSLAERLAARQMKQIRKGQKVLRLRHSNEDNEMSPFALVTVAPPPAPEPYKPVGGTIANLCYDARSRLYLMGAAMTMVAAGLVLGFGERKAL